MLHFPVHLGFFSRFALLSHKTWKQYISFFFSLDVASGEERTNNSTCNIRVWFYRSGLCITGMEGVSQTSKKVLNWRDTSKRAIVQKKFKTCSAIRMFTKCKSRDVGGARSPFTVAGPSPYLLRCNPPPLYLKAWVPPPPYHKKRRGKSDRVSDTFFGPPQGCHCARGEARADSWFLIPSTAVPPTTPPHNTTIGGRWQWMSQPGKEPQAERIELNPPPQPNRIGIRMYQFIGWYITEKQNVEKRGKSTSAVGQTKQQFFPPALVLLEEEVEASLSPCLLTPPLPSSSIHLAKPQHRRTLHGGS